MAIIVTRAGKGSALSFEDGDANFTNLNNDKLENTDLSVTTQPASGNGSLSYGNDGVFTYVPADLSSVDTALVNDTNPTLSADLQASGFSVVDPNLEGYSETIHTLTFATTLAPDVANGNVQTTTATANFTFNGFANAVAGQSLTLIITQDGTGSREMTSSMLFAGGEKTLSTDAGAIDIISVVYDGTNYYASLAKGFA